jgi:Mor family transcriptional regulator
VKQKLSDDDKIVIRRRIAEGTKEIELAREYSVSRQAINQIKFNQLGAGLGIDVSERTRANLRRERIELVERLADEGKTAQEISTALGMNLKNFYAFRQKFLPALKLKRRSRYKSRFIVGRKLNYDRANELREDHRSGLLVPTLMQKYGVSKATVYAVLEGRVWISKWTRE